MLHGTVFSGNLPRLLAIAYAILMVTSCEEKKNVVDIPQPPGAPTIVALNSSPPGLPLRVCIGTMGNGNDLEYQYDFGVGVPTDWTTDSCRFHHWVDEGQYAVRARVRRGDLESDWSPAQIVTIIVETIEPPSAPGGDVMVPIGGTIRFCAASAVSSLGHSIEYRFRVDPDDEWEWHIASCSSRRWSQAGAFRVRAQARCVLHNGNFSDWSQSREFLGISAAETEIVRVLSSSTLGGAAVDVNFLDQNPDTLPLGSWLTLIVEGSSPDYDVGNCVDTINRCVGFQFQYEAINIGVPSQFTSTWMPVVPVDGNPAGLRDTIRLNVGSVDYRLSPRAVDEYGVDVTAPKISVVGNFAPTMDDYYIQNFDGSIVRGGDAVSWNWWEPENTDTLDAGAGLRKKRFSFVIKAFAHDSSKELAGSGIEAWRYFFIAVDNPALFWPFSRAGSWVEPLQFNTLCDTVTWEVTYPADDVDGNEVFDILPEWINREWDYVVMGRDIPAGTAFEQYVRMAGQQITVQQYNADAFGRRTATGFQRFHIQLTR
jgi:hypothetical protein